MRRPELVRILEDAEVRKQVVDDAQQALYLARILYEDPPEGLNAWEGDWEAAFMTACDHM